MRKLITGFDFNHSGEKYLLAFLNCIFEAQTTRSVNFSSRNGSLLNDLRIILFNISLSPMDCLSLHYLLSSIRTVHMARRQIRLNIASCSIDDQCLGMLLGISNEHSETSTSGVLESVKGLGVHFNKYTDTGIAYIARALISNSITQTLFVGNDSVTDTGLVPLLELLPRLHSLEMLKLYWSLSHPDESLKKMGECVGRSTLKQLILFPYSPSFQSEEAVKEWVQIVVVGGNSLIRSLECSQVVTLWICIYFKNISCSIDEDGILAQVRSSFQETVTSVNLEREKKSICALYFHII